jgi:anti-anti-sigma regulatory factor
VAIWITRVLERDSTVRVKVEGQIIKNWGSVLKGECQELARQERNVILDLSGVTYVDSQGLDVLGQLESEGLRIVNIPRLIEDLLRGH